MTRSTAYRLAVLSCLTIAVTSATSLAEEKSPPKASPRGSNSQRTMSLLASATPEHRTPVKILLYGQSIVRQDYIRKRLAPELATPLSQCRNHHRESRHRRLHGPRPSAHRHARPLSLLPRTWSSSMSMVANEVNSRASFEVFARRLLPKSSLGHTTSIAEAPNAHRTSRPERNCGRELARKYDCELVELRKAWQKYLDDNNLEPSDLLVDVRPPQPTRWRTHGPTRGRTLHRTERESRLLGAPRPNLRR